MTTGVRVPLRADMARLGLVMDHLDRVELSTAMGAKRRHTRFSFRTGAPLLMECPREDGAVIYEVAPRNISARGMSVLFGAFIYPRTACQLVIPLRAGGAVRVKGALRWCRHVSRTVHEGGVEFGDRVDLAPVLGEDPDATTVAGPPEGSAVAPAPVARLDPGAAGRAYDELERAVMQMAAMVRDRRSLTELREQLERVRRMLDREDALGSLRRAQ